MSEVLKSIPVPKEKKFNINKYLKTEEGETSIRSSVLNIFPNPTNNIVNIQAFFTEKQKNASIFIYDLNGRLVWSKQYANVYFIKEHLNILRLANGVYNVSINTDSVQQSRKLVVSK